MALSYDATSIRSNRTRATTVYSAPHTTAHTSANARWAVIVRSVRRLGRVDLVDPRRDAATDVHRVLVASRLHDGQSLGGANTGLAVNDDLLVRRKLLQRSAAEELTLGDEHRARDPVDVVL